MISLTSVSLGETMTKDIPEIVKKLAKENVLDPIDWYVGEDRVQIINVTGQKYKFEIHPAPVMPEPTPIMKIKPRKAIVKSKK